MNNNNIVQVILDGTDKVYDFKNDHEFVIRVGDKVECKVGTGGTMTGNVVGFGKLKEGMSYKRIVEVFRMENNQKELQEGNKFVCDIRIWRNQWSKNGGYEYQWSDKVITCVYDESEQLQIGSSVVYQDTKGRVVNLRQLPVKKTLKMETVHLESKKKGFFARLFSK